MSSARRRSVIARAISARTIDGCVGGRFICFLRDKRRCRSASRSTQATRGRTIHTHHTAHKRLYTRRTGVGAPHVYTPRSQGQTAAHRLPHSCPGHRNHTHETGHPAHGTAYTRALPHVHRPHWSVGSHCIHVTPLDACANTHHTEHGCPVLRGGPRQHTQRTPSHHHDSVRSIATRPLLIALDAPSMIPLRGTHTPCPRPKLIVMVVSPQRRTPTQSPHAGSHPHAATAHF